jgi:hypothetical protein
MATVLFTPKGAISEADKEKLSKEDYVIIEVEDASQIKSITDLSLIGSDLIAITALETIKASNSSALMDSFGQRILTKTLSKINKPPTK